MYDQREGSMRELEEGGTAGDLGFELFVVQNCEAIVLFQTILSQIFVRI